MPGVFPYGAAIGAGANILGGMLGSKQSSRDFQRQMDWHLVTSDPLFHKYKYQAAGINPLLAFTNGQLQGTGVNFRSSATTFGDSLSRAGEMIGDGVDQYQAAKGAISELEAENERLNKELNETKFKSETRNAIYRPGSNGQSANGSRETGKAGSQDTEGPTLVDSAGSSPSSGPASDLDPGVIPTRDVYNLYASVYDPQTKRWMEIPNPDLMDAGPTEIIAAMTMLGIADATQNGAENTFERVSEYLQDKKGETTLQRILRRFRKPPLPKKDPEKFEATPETVPLRGYYGPHGSRTGF